MSFEWGIKRSGENYHYVNGKVEKVEDGNSDIKQEKKDLTIANFNDFINNCACLDQYLLFLNSRTTTYHPRFVYWCLNIIHMVQLALIGH